MNIKSLYVLVCASLVIFSCNQEPQKTNEVLKADVSSSKDNQESNMSTTLIHTVFFWTKEGTTEEQIDAFAEGLKKLGTCPQIHEYYWGPPAPTEARDVVDNSYTFAINVHFASVEKQNEYQEEPIHLEFIENHKDIWDKVIVYDNVVR